MGSPDDTLERMVAIAERLRHRENFGGYIHLKAIPGASPELVLRAGVAADRVSVNIELPSEDSLRLLAPQKTRQGILGPMKALSERCAENAEEHRRRKRPPPFAPAGQSTQMVVGASPENDFRILNLAEALYRNYGLKRVYYSAYIPVNEDNRLPALRDPPLLREHRLYQADWLVRFYGFQAGELLSPEAGDLDRRLDPKAAWAIRHPENFPIEVNRAPYEQLLRIPGVGVRSAQRICAARRFGSVGLDDLRKMGVVLKRAQFFITVRGTYFAGRRLEPNRIRHCLVSGNAAAATGYWQPELLDL
jgi:putative DNA modification/repair radical SAM protein